MNILSYILPDSRTVLQYAYITKGAGAAVKFQNFIWEQKVLIQHYRALLTIV